MRDYVRSGARGSGNAVQRMGSSRAAASGALGVFRGFQRDGVADIWTREIDLYLPVKDPDVWEARRPLIERMLKFLTGDIWRLSFRGREKAYVTLLKPPDKLALATFNSVCLFSGGGDDDAQGMGAEPEMDGAQ